jgi:hypothetical protein
VLELAYYRRIRFANKSEQLSPDQRALFDEAWAADITAIEAKIAQPDTEGTTTALPKPAHLPRIIHRHHEPASCQCGGALIKICEHIAQRN